MTTSEHLQGILDTLPNKPGCYIMKNSTGDVIYVGKAINLRNRVRSYFHEAARHEPRTRRLVTEIANLEWIVTDTELEALILAARARLVANPRAQYGSLAIQWELRRVGVAEIPPARTIERVLARAGVSRPRRRLSLIHISEPTRLLSTSYAVFCLKKKKPQHQKTE